MSSPIPSPPHKRVKTDTVPTGSMTEITEAPVTALFVPPPQASTSAAPIQAGPSTKKKAQTNGKGGKRRKQKRDLPEPYSAGEVLWYDIQDFLGRGYVDNVLAKKDGSEWAQPEDLELQSIVELRVGAFTVSGESLSVYPPSTSDNPKEDKKKWAILVPFAHPGDLIKARIYKHDRLHSLADLIEIVEYSEEFRGGEGDRRKNPNAGCKYFGECGGCQLQPIPYTLQLAHKRRTVQLAYSRFSALSSAQVPEVGETIPSPKQWGYRTKITPHFDAPPKRLQEGIRRRAKEAEEKRAREEEQRKQGMEKEEEEMGNEEEGLNGADQREAEVGEKEKAWEVRIGFERKGRPGVMDIEECPIATPILNSKLKPERARIQSTIHTFSRGATLLLRDSLVPPDPLPSAEKPYQTSPSDPTDAEAETAEQHVAITNHKENVYEKVGTWLFEFSAGSFFQNNNSILVPLVDYVKEAIFPSESSTTSKRPTHLIDTYCGSGLFSITLSTHFERIAGVEISEQSIKAAKRNAEINGLGEDKARWIVGKAEEIFGGEGLKEGGFEGGRSCVVVDPPRKGCDTPFLTQLLAFEPQTIVYVSCNVHTQARDVGWFLTQAEKEGKGYVLESLRGFDLFPQTAHVESVAVLRRRS